MKMDRFVKKIPRARHNSNIAPRSDEKRVDPVATGEIVEKEIEAPQLNDNSSDFRIPIDRLAKDEYIR